MPMLSDKQLEADGIVVWRALAVHVQEHGVEPSYRQMCARLHCSREWLQRRYDFLAIRRVINLELGVHRGLRLRRLPGDGESWRDVYLSSKVCRADDDAL